MLFLTVVAVSLKSTIAEREKTIGLPMSPVSLDGMHHRDFRRDWRGNRNERR